MAIPRTAAARSRQLASNAGKAFEKWVEGHHAWAISEGILAFVYHLEPPVIVTPKGPMYRAPSAADYGGVLTDGRCFAAEAKTTVHDRLPRDRISPLQAKHLDAVANTNNLAVLLVEFRQERAALWTVRRYAVPWALVPWRKARTVDSVTPGDLTRWEVHGPCYLRNFIEED